MASKGLIVPAKHLFVGFRSAAQQIQPSLVRSLTTQTSSSPDATVAETYANAQLSSASTEPILSDQVSELKRPSKSAILETIPKEHVPPRNPFLTTIHCTTYKFPSLEPSELVQYPSTHLALPLRRDILHRAVIFEADNTRLGTASTKWRAEIHGSSHKLRPQKGTGRARLGDRGSPMLRGGGVAFGPKPRDFSTELPRKVYDLAFRTALSHRFRAGELTILDGPAHLEIDPGSAARYVRDLLRHNGMGTANGKPIFVTSQPREALANAFMDERLSKQGKVKEVRNVDVKNLLEMGRVVIERKALEWLLLQHESDVDAQNRFLQWKSEAEARSQQS